MGMRVLIRKLSSASKNVHLSTWTNSSSIQRSSLFHSFTGDNSGRGVQGSGALWNGRVQNSSYRSYYVDRYGVRHFRPRGPGGWVAAGRGFTRKMAVVSGVLGVCAGVIYYTHLEVVPYTNRKHFVLISPQVEAMLGEVTFENMKLQFQSRILPPYHPAVVRVMKIAERSVQSAMEGVHASGQAKLKYATEVKPQIREKRRKLDVDFLRGPADGDDQQPRFLMKVTDKELYPDSEITLDEDVWVEDSRKEGKSKGRKPDTKHVDRFKWEIVVVDAPVMNAACLPGGKIIVFTGLLKAFPHDEEIATVLGHEVGHAIARHTGEMLTRSIFIGFFELLFLAIFQVPGIIGPASDLLLRLPFSRKMEMEADHIGVLVMAASGYDPRIAPRVYLKLGELQKIPEFVQYLSTHPSGKTRAEALTKSQALQEAIRIYETKRGAWGGFLM